MKSRSFVTWAIVAGAGFGILLGVAIRRTPARSNLATTAPVRPSPPADSRYAKLPVAFAEALRQAQDQVRASKNDPEEIRKLARLYQANRLYREASACYETIAAIPPGLVARDHYYLADIAQNENDLAAAEKEFRVVLQTEPRYVPARLSLADAAFKTGRADEAAKEYSAVLAIEANQPQAMLGLARIELQRGDDDAAVARLEELMAAHPESTAGAGLFSQVLERRGETDRAVAMAQWSQQKPEPPPADPWLNALLADCYDVQRLSITFEEYFKIGKMEEAVPVLDRLAALDPQGPIPKMFAGFSHAKALEHITAVREYYEALGKGGDPEKICPYLVQSLLALGKVTEAAQLMADYHAKMPDSLPLTKVYADVALRQGDDPLARSLLEKVLQKEPYLQPQNMSLAKILWAAGERDAAAQCLQRVAMVYANDVASRALLGEYYLGKGDPLAAIKPLEQARPYLTARTPAQEKVTEMLGVAYLAAGNLESEKGRLAEAADFFDQALRLNPANLDGYVGKANACAQLKQFGRAADALGQLAALDPRNPTVYLSWGDVLYQNGDAGRAREQWQKARALVAGGNDELVAALDLRLNGHITADTFK